MCEHSNLLDDVHTGDMVCMDCGLVVGRFYGFGHGIKGGGVKRHFARTKSMEAKWKSERAGMLERFRQEHPDNGGGKKSSPALELIRTVLDLFRLDTREVVREVYRCYWGIYGWREAKKRDEAEDGGGAEAEEGGGDGGGANSEHKRNLACAFAIANTLAKLGIPRPPEHVANLCGIDRVGELLQAPRKLNMSEKNMVHFPALWTEFDVEGPEYYVDNVAISSGFTHNMCRDAFNLAACMRWKLHGKKPTVICATALFFVLRKHKLIKEKEMEEMILNQLGVAKSTVEATLKVF